jgi:hypothetical protein
MNRLGNPAERVVKAVFVTKTKVVSAVVPVFSAAGLFPTSGPHGSPRQP